MLIVITMYNNNENCGTKKKVEETFFVCHIIHASMCSILYLSETVYKISK